MGSINICVLNVKQPFGLLSAVYIFMSNIDVYTYFYYSYYYVFIKDCRNIVQMSLKVANVAHFIYRLPIHSGIATHFGGTFGFSSKVFP